MLDRMLGLLRSRDRRGSRRDSSMRSRFLLRPCLRGLGLLRKGSRQLAAHLGQTTDSLQSGPAPTTCRAGIRGRLDGFNPGTGRQL